MSIPFSSPYPPPLFLNHPISHPFPHPQVCCGLPWVIFNVCHVIWGKVQTLPPVSRMREYPSMWFGLPNSIHELGINTDPLLEAPQINQIFKMTSSFRASVTDLCCFATYQSWVNEHSLDRVSFFCGFIQPGLNPFANHSSLSATVFQSSLHCLAVGVCFCFHHLLDENSRMAYKVVINLITGEGLLRQPCSFHLYCQVGLTLYISRHCPSV